MKKMAKNQVRIFKDVLQCIEKKKDKDKSKKKKKKDKELEG